jgi:protein-S-isoprenylcysteine O-methyltransferase Ste14
VENAKLNRLMSLLVVFFVSLVLTMLGVFLFFKPIADSETNLLALPPAVGLIYILLCSVIYLWAFKEMGNSYKAALVVVLPQAALIVDLMLRGDRGPITTIAGCALLFATWVVTAFAHDRFINS